MSEFGVRLTDRVRTRGVLDPDLTARLLLPVAESLASVHAASDRHGAVSPAAVEVDATGRATLLDRTRVAPDPAYAAPDPHRGLRQDGAADDVWSFAGVLLFVSTGRPPVPGEPTPRDAGWLAPITELALQADPRDRPTMAEVADYLRARVRPGEQGRSSSRRSRPVALVLAGVAVIAGLGLGGGALLLAGTEDDPPARDRTSGSTADPADDGDGERDGDRPTATASAEPPSAGELERFARTYVATASRDPDAGFALLTMDYQQSSPRYREVWSAIRDPEILAVAGDPDTLSVRYTYRYDLPGGVQRTEEVTLRLVQRSERLLIAGASAVVL